MTELEKAKKATRNAVIAGVDRNTILDILIEFGALGLSDIKPSDMKSYIQKIEEAERRTRDEQSNKKKEEAALC